MPISLDSPLNSPSSNSDSQPTASNEASVWNVPNAITSVRFVLAIVVMVLIPMDLPLAAMIVFTIAAATDWMDGYWARKYNQVTRLGRIFDPFVDKIIICGAFIALVQWDATLVPAWMAIVIVARELLVTSLRGLVEGAGGDFSANQLGKWKMVAQCVAVVAALATKAFPETSFIGPFAIASIWTSIVMTVWSGAVYVIAAARQLSSSDSA